MTDIKNYSLVTGAYWGFTLTDGALRMLVLLHFYEFGYSAVQIAFLFLLYEFFGVVTNLIGGWIGSHVGLKVTLFSGLALQIAALFILGLLDPHWSPLFSVCYVMSLQALSGIAKDLTKMSSKSAIKVLLPEDADSVLFKWVAILTGSKNALKGAGFFLGGLLLTTVGFRNSLWLMAAGLLLVLLATLFSLPKEIGMAKKKRSFPLSSPRVGISICCRQRGCFFSVHGISGLWSVCRSSSPPASAGIIPRSAGFSLSG